MASANPTRSRRATWTAEADLVRSFSSIVTTKRTSLPQMEVAFEFPFVGGKTDIIGVTQKGTVHSFEAKLRRWRDCLNQAYRNTAFSHYSYVLLPRDTALNALREREQFRKRGVGLCSFENNRIHLHIRPAKQNPLQPWVTKRAASCVARSAGNA